MQAQAVHNPCKQTKQRFVKPVLKLVLPGSSGIVHIRPNTLSLPKKWAKTSNTVETYLQYTL